MNPQEEPNELKNDPLHIGPLSTNKSKIKQNQLMKADVIPRHPSSVIFNGSSGLGKSNLVCTLLKEPQFYGKYFKKKNIYLISPTGVSDDMFEHLKLPSSNIIVDIRKGAKAKLESIMSEQLEVIDSKGIEKAEKVLIIFEDIQSNGPFMRSSEFLKCFLMNRHYGLSVWLCGQSFKLTPKACRIQANNIFCFQPTNSEREILVENYTPPGMSKKRFIDVINQATEAPWSFMHINKRVGFAKRYRRNLGNIILVNNYSD